MKDDKRNKNITIYNAANLKLELINKNTGLRENIVVENNHDIIVNLVQNFADRQRVPTQSVQIQLDPDS